MAEIHSRVTELPESCKSAAEHMAAELIKEEKEEQADRYVNLDGDCAGRLTQLEQLIAEKTGSKVALVAYKLS